MFFKKVKMIEFWILGNHIQYSKYWFSSHGRVYSLKKNMMLEGTVTESGYINIMLTNDKWVKERKKLHWLIASVFLGRQPDKNSTVDHIDRNRQNTHFTNLRWATKSEQAINQNTPTNYAGRSIYQFSIDMMIYQKWISMTLAASSLGLKTDGISYACRTKALYNGFYWLYSEDIETCEGEVFRVIPGYSKYQVSNMGRVKYPDGRIIASKDNANGYCRVGMESDVTKTRKMVAMHKLVMLTFVGERPKNMVINHKNGIKIDNRPENLEYITISQNTIHAKEMGLINRAKGSASKTAVAVIRTNLDGSNPVHYGSITEGAIASGDEKLKKHIGEVCKGTKKSLGGYKWHYYRDVQHLCNISNI